MFADVSSAVNTGCFFIPADPDAQPGSKPAGTAQPGKDSSAPGYSPGRPHRHTSKEAAKRGSSLGGGQHSWIEERYLNTDQIDEGTSLAFARLLHSTSTFEPSRLTPLQKLDF
eukprot:9453775-Heterocapsa_arctica.AAC.1